MAKQIKVIQCPQCGNTKPVPTGKDQYRCDKCATEFFLDNDDVNVNINHRYEGGGGSGTSALKGVMILLCIGVVLAIVLVVAVSLIGSSKSSKPTVSNQRVEKTVKAPKVENKKYLFSMLPAKGKGIVFCLTNRDGNTYAVFHDVKTGKPVKEQMLATPIRQNQSVTHRWFMSDSTDYLVIHEKLIYKVDPLQSLCIDITAQICESKPALKEGIMSAAFVEEGEGDGFIFHTNLGKTLYYFPKTDMLCTEKAYDVLSKDNSAKTIGSASNQIYYLFQNRESVHSSNVAQLFEITYKFNNGGPEDRLKQLASLDKNVLEKYRITSCKPITEDRVYFSPVVLYYDHQNILIAYYPSLAAQATPHVELLDTSGKVLWTASLKNAVKSINTVRTSDGFMLQTDEQVFNEIRDNGKQVQTYQLP